MINILIQCKIGNLSNVREYCVDDHENALEILEMSSTNSLLSLVYLHIYMPCHCQEQAVVDRVVGDFGKFSANLHVCVLMVGAPF